VLIHRIHIDTTNSYRCTESIPIHWILIDIPNSYRYIEFILVHFLSIHWIHIGIGVLNWCRQTYELLSLVKTQIRCARENIQPIWTHTDVMLCALNRGEAAGGRIKLISRFGRVCIFLNATAQRHPKPQLYALNPSTCMALLHEYCRAVMFILYAETHVTCRYWSVAANVLNELSWTADKGKSPRLAVGQGAKKFGG
jgi:hypothetical protein